MASYDLSCHIYSFDTHVSFYTCLLYLAKSIGVTHGITGDDLDATAYEVDEFEVETPQQLAEWVLEDVF